MKADEQLDKISKLDETLNRTIPTLPHISGAPYKLGGVPSSGILTRRKDSYATNMPSGVGDEVRYCDLQSILLITIKI